MNNYTRLFKKQKAKRKLRLTDNLKLLRFGIIGILLSFGFTIYVDNLEETRLATAKTQMTSFEERIRFEQKLYQSEFFKTCMINKIGDKFIPWNMKDESKSRNYCLEKMLASL